MPKEPLVEKVKSPSIRRMARNLLTKATPGTFLRSTWRPVPQRDGGIPVVATKFRCVHVSVVSSSDLRMAFQWPRWILGHADDVLSLMRPQ
jgi:hypothetical protein